MKYREFVERVEKKQEEITLFVSKLTNEELEAVRLFIHIKALEDEINYRKTWLKDSKKQMKKFKTMKILKQISRFDTDFLFYEELKWEIRGRGIWS